MSFGQRRFALSCALLLVLSGGCNLGQNREDRAETNQAKGGGLGGLLGRGGGNIQQNAAQEPEPTPTENQSGNDSEPAPALGNSPNLTDKPTGDSGQQTATRDNLDRRMRIVNDSEQRITLVQGSPVSDSNWGVDRIPTTTIAAGESLIVDFNDNNGECRYDLRVTFANAETAERRGVNICEAYEWRAAPGGGSVR